MTAVGTGLGWRLAHVVGKLCGARAYVPWDVLWREISTRHDLAFQPPDFRVEERDDELELVRMNGGGADYWVPEHTHELSMQQIHKEVYNPQHPHYYELDACRVREGDVVLDGGACEGIFVRFALDRGARVIAVEPWSRMCRALERTFAAEAADGRFAVVQALLSDREGSSSLVLHPKFPFEAREGHSEDEGLLTETVPVTTVDRVVTGSTWGRCDFLKLDIEGSETEALPASAETIREFRPRIAVAVYHKPEGYRLLADRLRRSGLGYRVTGKGLQLADGTWRPMVLHAWVP